MYRAIGIQVRHRRLEKYMTQEQLSQNAGISPPFLGHIERGTRKLSVETLVALCEALECSPNDLLGCDIPDSRRLIDVLRTALIRLEELSEKGLLDGDTEQ